MAVVTRVCPLRCKVDAPPTTAHALPSRGVTLAMCRVHATVEREESARALGKSERAHAWGARVPRFASTGPCSLSSIAVQSELSRQQARSAVLQPVSAATSVE